MGMKALIPLYTIEYTDLNHSYKMDGKPAPSVTQVLQGKEAMDDFLFNSSAFQNFKAAGEWGTKVHNCCNLLNHKKPVDHLETEVRRWAAHWIKYLKDHNLIVIASELKVGSRKYRYAGTLDVIVAPRNDPTHLIMIDLKCTAAFPPTVGLQTAGYTYAFEEQYGLKIAERRVLRITSDKIHPRPCADASDIHVFLCKVISWHWDFEHLK